LFVNVATYPDSNQFEIDVYKGGIEATKFIANNQTIDTVLMVSRGPYYISGPGNFYLLSNPQLTDKKKVFEIGLRATLDLMVKNNKKIILILENPTFDINPELCIENRPLRISSKSNDCLLDKNKFILEHKEYRDMIFTISKDYPSIKIFDPSIYLCDENYCRGKIDGKILYGDRDHLSLEGANFISERLIQLVH